MKSLSASIVTAALLVAGVSAQFQINTPNPPTQCVPTQFSWQGGSPPFFLAINPGGVPGAPALQQYSGLTSSPFTWSTNITAGTSISLTLSDSTGAVAQSAPVTIQSGPDTCLNGQGSTTGGATSTTAQTGSTTGSTTSAGSTTGSATSPASNTSSGSKTSGSSTGTSSGTSAQTSPTGGNDNNAAFSNAASAGLVGVIGVVAAAILA